MAELVDHDNIVDKRWYGDVLIVGRKIENVATLPLLWRNKSLAVIYLYKGSLTMEIDGDALTMEAPYLFVLPPHSYNGITETSPDIECQCIGVAYELLDKLRLVYDYNTALCYFQRLAGPLSDEAKELFETYFQLVFSLAALPRTPFNDSTVGGVLQSFFNLFLYYYSTNFGDKRENLAQSRAEQISSRFIALVQVQALRERNVQFYADALGVSAKYLSNTVKRTTSLSPAKWIRKRVVAEAKQLLDDVSLSIQQIADRLNFINASHFGAFFKKETGMTPLQFRKRLS